ncbi:helix-turn-helix domain-containing protein [Herbiconiux sp. P15]|uniref:helix-turn-helix domain-containing protein n=1 Tax=Herbiconiux liukaitaii TaxID=3342799 RepID=UPI0035BB87D1
MDESLGPRLRAARASRHLSLRAVATSIGVSPSLLSQVERGKSLPSVSTLTTLVHHLGVSMDELLLNAGEESPRDEYSPVQRSFENPVIEMENGVVWERLAVSPSRTVEPRIATYAPGASSSVEGRMVSHPGIEHAYVLEGVLTLRLEYETHRLSPGDSLSFDAMRPHMFVNETRSQVRGLWFVVGASPTAPR